MNRPILFSWIIVMVMGKEIYKNYAQQGGCGIRFVMSLRIVGGEHAHKAELPWMVSLTMGGGHICGGSIISEKFILTAAHCFCSDLDDEYYRANRIKASLAQHDLDENIHTNAYDMAVKSINIHPGYQCRVAKDDIALLELKDEIKWSRTVAPICVSTLKNQDELDYNFVTVAGWGWTSENITIGQRSNRLRKAKVQVINTDVCRRWYKAEKKHLRILDSHICAGYKNGGIDACWADSGGPLMMNVDESTNQMMQIGVISTGRGCARARLPGIYTKVADYIKWIEKIIYEHLKHDFLVIHLKP